jgi:hypothetical protein
MASHTHDFGKASALPLSAVLASLPSYPRPIIERLVTRLIDKLDTEDGDQDVECNGDELDFNQAEDDFEEYSCSHVDMGAGCPVSDAGENGHDAEIQSWSNPNDCPTDVFIGRRTPARQLGDE